MKKILLSILMLLLTVTAAWAGDDDGSKDHPFTGEWEASDLGSLIRINIAQGKDTYLAYDCDIQNGSITVTDSKLNNTVIVNGWPAWSPGNVLGSSNYSGYSEYYKNNSLGDRKSQLFIITDASGSGSTIHMTGYFSGRYSHANIVLPKKEVDNVEYYVINSDEDYETFRQIVATGNPYANAVLENDIKVTKPIGGGGPQFHYRGTFDGQGHTIDVGSLPNDNENHPWGLFQFTEPGCVIRNLKVTGELTSGHEYLGAIVGEAVGTRLENCISDAKLKNTSSTLPVTGGLIGAGHGVNFIENCAFIGSLQSSGQSSGLVGRNIQMVSIKSCYVAPESIAGSGSMFTDQISEVETFKNNYQCTQLANGDSSPLGKDVRSTSITNDEVKNGMLCYKLNQNGRKGIVWYQNSDGYPYPFRTNNCKMIVSDDGGSTVDGNIVPCLHGKGFNDDHICSICGATDPVVTIEPLQDSGEDKEFSGDIFVGYLRYKLDTNNKTATVKGTHHYAGDLHEGVKNRDATAVHIPETIIYNGVKYTVKYIGKSSFNSSVMEYCYVPKTITHIEDDAFNSCSNLKYLHIADCPSAGTSSLYLGHKDEDNELFEDCSKLEKVYIGRDLRWYPYSKWNPYKPDEPFEDRNSITDVFFGPRVTRVGNYYKEGAREGNSYDLFNDASGLNSVYIMGDDQSLKEKNLEFWCVDDLGRARNYYINRNIAYTDQFVYTPGLVSSFTEKGCLDACEHVTYGPFVKSITKESFTGVPYTNTTLKSADFTNAFRLERIEEAAFYQCKELDCALDFSNTQLKVIENSAFFDVDKVTAVNFGSRLEKIGEWAFNNSDRITTISLPGTVTEVGDVAFGNMGGLSTIRLEDGDGHIKFLGNGSAFEATANPLADSKVSYIYQGRDYEYKGQPPFAECKKVISVTIGPKVTKLNKNGYKNIESFAITFLYSPDALRFEHNPTEVFDNSKVHAMFIDRELLDMKEGSDETTSRINWGSNVKNNVENLSFGDHITAIPDNLFENFSNLKSVIIPNSVKTIGVGAFEHCNKLEYLSVLGDINIDYRAFNECTNLKHLIFTSEDTYLATEAFASCDNIEEVITGFMRSNPKQGPNKNAFTDTAYQNAHLTCAGDTRTQKLELTTIPWKYFNKANRNSILQANDYDIEEGDPKVADYDHGYMPHSFTKDKYELVYAPFQMDSYYFGPEADIYKMELTNTDGGMKFTDDYSAGSETKTYNIDDINFSKVDIDNEMLLSRGVYLVNKKTDKPLNDIASYHNLFREKAVSVDNESFSAQGGGTATMSYNSDYPNPQAITPTTANDIFVCNEGVLKLVNDNYQPKVGEIVFTSPCEEGKHPVFNMMDGENNTILSSKIDIPFNAILDGYASFYAAKTANFNYIAPSWCDVYIVTSADGETVTLQKIEDRTINAGQAVLLKSNNEEKLADNLTEYLTFATNQSSASYTGNLLKGVEMETPVSELGREFVYVLSKTAGNSTGFYKYNKTLNAGKAYLDPDGLSTENLAKSCLFTFKDTATGIKPMSESMSESIYDLMGRRLKEAGFKGVYIVNGKKVVVK